MRRRQAFPAFALCLSALAGTLAFASGVPADPFLEHYAVTNRFRSGKPEAMQATPDGKAILFLRSGPRDLVRDLYEQDLDTGQERVVLTASSLLGGKDEELSVEERARRERQRLIAKGFGSYQLSPDGHLVLLPLGGFLYLFDRESGTSRKLENGGGSPIDARFSPDGKTIAFVRGNEIHLLDVRSGNEKQLTTGAGGAISHGLSEFVAQEEMDRDHGYWWSPDSKWIAFQETDTKDVEPFSIMDPTHPEKAPTTWPYPRPGHTNATVRLGIIPVDGGEPRWLDWDRAQFEYLGAVQWSKNGPLTVVLQNREQTHEEVFAVDARTGSMTRLLEETDDAWINLNSRMPVWLEHGERFLWITERHGQKELELRAKDGSLVTTVGPPGLQEFEHYFPESKTVVVRASADPTESHLYTVSLDGPGPKFQRVTMDPAVHTVANGDRGPLCVFSFENARGEAHYRILGPKGLLYQQEIASKAETPGFTPKLEFTTAGSQECNAVIIRPADFNPASQYPVIVSVYGGPHSQMVKKQPSMYFLPQWMADQGYIVVSIDGRGTPNRGRDWERAIKGNLIEIPLKDQSEALQDLCKRYKEMNCSRTGIYGWSFGGYFSAMAVTERPDVYQAGVAGAPVTDWRDYDTHYTERYMGLPEANEGGYESSSALTHAPELQRPLLIIHGTSDDNVYFMHSLKLSGALFRAGKSFEFLPLAGFTHMVPDPVVIESMYSRVMNFFGEKLAAPARKEP